MSTHATLARLCAATFFSLFLCGPDARAQSGPPAFPQKFDVRGPENASFAFAVTQPGPIVVDVQWQGAPLRAALVGPNTVQQQGSGRLVINYDVTPQDLQRGTLWSVNLGLLTPSPNGATGQVNVQTPPVDGAAATRVSQLVRRTLTQQETEQVNAAFNASVERYVNLRMSEFRRDLANRDQAERQKLQMILAQPVGATTGLAQPPAMQPGVTQAPGAVRSRAIPPLGGGGTKIEAAKLPPGQRPVLVPIVPFEITSLSQTSGGPVATLVITGTSFGTSPGRVMLTVPAGIMVSPCTNCAPVPTNNLPDTAITATIAQWTDTRITLSLPDLTGVHRYLANLFVVRADNAYSNRMVFDFVPRQELRVFRSVPGDRRYTSTVVTRPLPPTSGTSMSHVRFPAFPFSEFVGEKGNDEYFPYTDLSNGWTVSRVRVVPIGEISGIPPEIQTIIREGGGAYIEGTPSGTDLYLNVRWWINALFPYMFYAWTLEITGPAGTPDGVIVR
jgi:hypothetical protein